MAKQLEARIRKLESRFITEPMVLEFADGSTRELRGPKDFVMDLFAGICPGANLTPQRAEQLELIRQSVCSREPGGAHMVELLRAILCSPSEPALESESGNSAFTGQ